MCTLLVVYIKSNVHTHGDAHSWWYICILVLFYHLFDLQTVESAYITNGQLSKPNSLCIKMNDMILQKHAVYHQSTGPRPLSLINIIRTNEAVVTNSIFNTTLQQIMKYKVKMLVLGQQYGSPDKSAHHQVWVLSLISWCNMVEGENQFQVALWPPYICCGIWACTHIHYK